MEIELKSRDQNLTLDFGQINHLNETGMQKSKFSSLNSFPISVDDKGPRPSENSTICVSVVQIHENTSKLFTLRATADICRPMNNECTQNCHCLNHKAVYMCVCMLPLL